MGKVLEQVVAGDISVHFSENYFLSDKQFGFRSARSFANISEDLQETPVEGLDTLVVVHDIAGAFDRVWHVGSPIVSRVTSLCC